MRRLPSNGRFLQKDSDPGQMTSPLSITNKYAYAGNNPAMNSDPTGTTNFFGWAIAAIFPGVTFDLANTTNIFQSSFGFTSGDVKGVNTATFAAIVAGVSPATFVSAVGSSLIQSAFKGDWSLNSFENEFYQNVVYGAISEGVLDFVGDPNTLQNPTWLDLAGGGLRGVGLTAGTELYFSTPALRASVWDLQYYVTGVGITKLPSPTPGKGEF